jgi:hypothetical protein
MMVRKEQEGGKERKPKRREMLTDKMFLVPHWMSLDVDSDDSDNDEECCEYLSVRVEHGYEIKDLVAQCIAAELEGQPLYTKNYKWTKCTCHTLIHLFCPLCKGRGSPLFQNDTESQNDS